jgi:hypothetical protein
MIAYDLGWTSFDTSNSVSSAIGGSVSISDTGSSGGTFSIQNTVSLSAVAVQSTNPNLLLTKPVFQDCDLHQHNVLGGLLPLKKPPHISFLFVDTLPI